MVQALAFAELLVGAVLALAGYKGVTPTEVVKGEAGSTAPAKPLGEGATGVTGSTEAAGGSGGVGSTNPVSHPASAFSNPGTGSGTPITSGEKRTAKQIAAGTHAVKPSVAGALTWDSLRAKVKAGKETPAQLVKDEEQLTGHKIQPLNQPPVHAH